tara:strand:+ start:589 stop:3672 length:3084 start_codon:yes stop_codon:yes gene_type:complete
MTKMIQPSMAGGEVSAPVAARVDLGKRAVAVEVAENFVATFTGAMTSRAGTSFVAQCKAGAGPHRIIEFEFNNEQTFVIEMGDAYIRFHTLGTQILDSDAVKTITGVTAADPAVVTSTAHGLSNGDEVYISDVVGMTELNGRNFLIANVATDTFELQSLGSVDTDASAYTAYTSGGTATPPYEVVAPWAAADLFKVGYAQSGDIMTLTHADYPPQELIRIDNDSWTLTKVILEPTQNAPTAIEAYVNPPVDAVAITAVTQANPAVVTSTGHGLETGDRVLINGVEGMVELNNFTYEIISLDANTFTLKYNQSGVVVDSTTFSAYTSGGAFRVSVRPRQYAVTAVSSDDGEQSLRGACLLQDGAAAVTLTGVTQADPIVISTADGHGLETGDDVIINSVVGMTELNGRRFDVVFVGPLTFSLRTLDGRDIDSSTFSAYVSGGIVSRLSFNLHSSAAAEWDNSLRWDTADGAEYYNVYATEASGLFGYVGTTTKGAFEDVNIGPDYTRTPPISYDPFDTFAGQTGVAPQATGFFQQRRYFANSNMFPNRFWASQIGHLSNFSKSVPALDDDAISATIAARRINEIKHIVPLSDLILLTGGGEYRVTGGQDGAIKPSALNVSPQSYYGATDIRPIVAGDVGLFVTVGEFVRDLSFNIERGKFVGKDITLLARHLFDYTTIVDWDYAPSPYNIGFTVMADGSGCYLTYQPDQDVYAWCRTSTKGKYKSTCVIREGSVDVIYVAVERTLNGATGTYIERTDDRKFEELSDAFCVDSGLTLDVPIAITGATAANPVVITAVAHGLSNGDTVDLSAIRETTTATNTGEQLSTGAEGYNGTGYTVANITTDTFELTIEGTNVDGSAYAAYSSGGAARKAVTTVSGLWHLEGATVVATANGYAENNLVVTNGSITLGAPASRIHVGLGYFCRLITLPLTQYADGRGTDGRAKNVSRLTVQVARSMGMWFGPSIDLMREAKFGLPALYGQPLEAVTEDIDVTMKANWGKRKQVVLEQRDPLPLTILALIPDATLGGN